MSSRSSARDAGPADPDAVALDGIKPPPGCDDPTLVVWREYGSRSERLRTLAACFFIYAAGGGLLVLLRPDFLDSRDSIVALVLVLCLFALFHFWVMVGPTDVIYAAGDSWFLLAGRGYSSRRRQTPSPRSYSIIRSDELRRVRIVRRTKVGAVTTSVRLTDVNGRYIGFKLGALQQCPPLAALVDRATSARDDIRVGDGLRDALDAATTSMPSGGGITVVRPGFKW